MASELVGVPGFEPAASSSRSQRATWLTATLTELTCLGSFVDIRWRPLVSMTVVTDLVTHPPKSTVQERAVVPSRSHG